MTFSQSFFFTEESKVSGLKWLTPLKDLVLVEEPGWVVLLPKSVLAMCCMAVMHMTVVSEIVALAPDGFSLPDLRFCMHTLQQESEHSEHPNPFACLGSSTSIE